MIDRVNIYPQSCLMLSKLSWVVTCLVQTNLYVETNDSFDFFIKCRVMSQGPVQLAVPFLVKMT